MKPLQLVIILITGFFFSLRLEAARPSANSSPIKCQLEWKAPIETKLPNEEVFRNQYFTGATLDEDFLPVFHETFQLPSGSSEGRPVIRIIRTELVTDLTGIRFPERISNDFKVTATTVYRKKAPFASVLVTPFRRLSTGGIERLVEFDLSVSPAGQAPLRTARMTTRNSVLASGNWYRLAIVNDGAYRIGYDLLKSMGVDADNIDPRSIRIYGNGGGQLPYLNSAQRFDDLEENAIFVSGESDGRFNSGDYILFYGSSQTRWKYDPSSRQFAHAINNYCDTTYYFLTTDLGNGKRMTTRGNSPGVPNQTVSSFNDYAFHEVDENNLLKSGREWYGEELDNLNTTREFTFSFPNKSVSDTLFLRASLLGRATNSINHVNNSFTLKVNGVQLATQGFSDVGTSTQDNFALPVFMSSTLTGLPSSVTVSVSIYSSDPNAQGWINYIELNTRSGLSTAGRGTNFHFRDINTVGPGTIAQFDISGTTADNIIWDVSVPTAPVIQQAQLNNNILSFVSETSILREYVTFRPSSVLAPAYAGRIGNQNLHALPQPDMVIVSYNEFVPYANQLAEFHRSRGLTVHVLTSREIFNEFSSGAQDVSAIRNLIKMFYDRASSPADMPRYLLLFGDASYDNKYRIQDNTNFVVSYQSYGSLNNTQTYMSDDFFGLLDDSEGEWTSSEIVDLAVGRLPVKSTAEASAAVRKILNYGGANLSAALLNSPNTPLGDWRNTISFVGDDQDNNTHFKQSDTLAARTSRNYPVYNIDKIYIDAYNQLSTPGGQRYPDAQKAIIDRVERGALLLTYVGHGGEVGWAHERILEVNDINAWTNFQRMPAFLTATCEFTRVDDPGRTSAGEYVFLNPNGGGICLFTTSRLAFSSSNNNLCQRFFTHVFEPFENRFPTIGEVFEQTKIDVYTDQYVRNFILIGDPALPMAYPKWKVKTKTINGSPVQLASDTMKALSRITITGEIQDEAGNRLTSFNGICNPTVYDKWVTYYTLGNDQNITNDPSYPQPFRAQRNVIYRGKVSVVNGQFSFTFLVPKDIQYTYGFGKISYYAQSGTADAYGYDTSVVVGGYNSSGFADDAGPQIQLFLNDEKFVRGGITDNNPSLYAIIADSSGINAVGSGIGHDITAVLDNNTNEVFVLNDYFQNDLNSYQTGTVKYPFENLSAGPHTLKFKVWDVHNNSSEATTEFIVAESADLALDHVLNYPNPFTTNTRFMFEHNRPYTTLDVQVQIFTISGKLIKTINNKIFTEGYRSDEVQWDGLDDYGDKIGKGVYLYKLKVSAPDGSNADKFEKLVILR